MRHALLLLFLATLAILGLDRAFGYDTARAIAYGAVIPMGAMIAATFLWLWAMRATPLALGMAFSWAGTTAVFAWWWIFAALGAPEALATAPVLFPFVALHLVGAILHFHVLERSMALRPGAFLVPVVIAFGLSATMAALI